MIKLLRNRRGFPLREIRVGEAQNPGPDQVHRRRLRGKSAPPLFEREDIAGAASSGIY